MKKIGIVLVFALSAIVAFGQDITLPQPAKKSGTDLFSAIQSRSAARAFVKRDTPLQDLSAILWAGMGLRGVDAVTSATKAGRNISFSGDNAYINLYLLNEKGTYKYIPESNTLKFLTNKDSRSSVSSGAVAGAAFMVLFTVDNSLIPSFLKNNPALFQQMAHATAGFAAQNIALAASAFRLSTIVKYTLDPGGATAAAKLKQEEVPLFIIQAGYTQ